MIYFWYLRRLDGETQIKIRKREWKGGERNTRKKKRLTLM